MSDALPLPARPNIEQYKKLAKDFQHACKSGQPGAMRDWSAHWAETLARLHGRAVQREICEDIERVQRQWHKLQKSNQQAARCTLSLAQLFIARCHGFVSWPKFAKHIEAMRRENSPISLFETTVDAIVSGDLPKLQKLLARNPDLVRARSTRDHRSTLLHYVSANGVEDFRQKTPKNIVAITRKLLETGADVNAESDAYGGRSTTLGLTATSCHPEAAGVQLPLMELLIEHGAVIDSPDGGSAVNGCLHNGRREAAEFFANHGARLDLEGAAGVGRLDIVKSFFNADGSLKPPATEKQLIDGFTWACEFGRINVVDFLLQKGFQAGTKLTRGETGLHWAAFEGHADLVRLLLEHGAPVDVVEEVHGGTPLGWALYGWGGSSKVRHYYDVVALLARAGAELDQTWFEVDDDQRRRTIRKLQSDPRMLSALAWKRVN